MVKSHRRQHSSSEEEEVDYSKHKKQKHHRRSHSRERKDAHYRHKHRSRSQSPNHRENRVKREREEDGSRGKHSSSSRHRGREEPVRYDPHKRIKQEPGEDHRRQRAERQRNNDRRMQARRNRNEDDMNFGRPNDEPDDSEPAQPKQEPNFELSGKLTEDTNTYKGVVIKYNEPPEARKPTKRWRLYPFKNDEPLKVLHMHRQSAFLLGRDRIVADIPIDHPSCSKQHAVFQYRLVDFKKEDGRKGRRIAPYIIDLDSANGTFVNNQKIEAQRYYELFEKDVIKFGFSSREYVLLHDKSNTAEVEDTDEVE